MSPGNDRGRPLAKGGPNVENVTSDHDIASVGAVTHNGTQDAHPADAADIDPWWLDGAHRALAVEAESGRIFSADTLRTDPYSLPNPHHPAAWGGLFARAHRAGIIKPVGFATSTTPSRHGGVSRLWRGTKPHRDGDLLHRGGGDLLHGGAAR